MYTSGTIVPQNLCGSKGMSYPYFTPLHYTLITVDITGF